MMNYQVHGSVAQIRFSNEEANSLTLEDALELQKIAQKIAKTSGISAIIFLSGSRRFFCTGGNLLQYSKLTRQKGILTNRRIRRALLLFSKLQVPKIALVAGDCLGGGMELLSCFDRIIASPGAAFGFWQRRLGLTFGWGGGSRWETKLGRIQIIQLAMESRTMAAYEAKTKGIVHEIVPENLLLSEAQAWSERMARLPQMPVRSLLTWQAKHENKIFEKLWLNTEHQAALRKFLKRNS